MKTFSEEFKNETIARVIEQKMRNRDGIVTCPFSDEFVFRVNVTLCKSTCGVIFKGLRFNPGRWGEYSCPCAQYKHENYTISKFWKAME